MAKGPIVDGFFLGPMTILIVGGGHEGRRSFIA